MHTGLLRVTVVLAFNRLNQVTCLIFKFSSVHHRPSLPIHDTVDIGPANEFVKDSLVRHLLGKTTGLGGLQEGEESMAWWLLSHRIQDRQAQLHLGKRQDVMYQK